MKEIYKAYRFRVYPNKIQEVLINKTLGSSRFIYNQMLSERKDVYEKLKDDKDALKSYKYTTEKEFKKEHEFLKEVDSIALQQSRMDLKTAFDNFFKSLSGKRKGKKMGFPKFHAKKSNQSYRTVNVNNNIDICFSDKTLKLPKIGRVKYRDPRMFNGIIKNVTVRKVASGKYYASILVQEFIDSNIHQINSSSRCIGLDMDMKNFFTDNQGETANYPRFYRLHEKKLAKEQRRLSRKVKGSNNRSKQRVKVARVHEKISNARKDFHSKLSTKLVQEYDVIGVETLNMQAMSQCLKLGKSVMDNGWGSFVNMLEYKCDWYGKHLVFADKMYASSKMCSSCGYKNTKLTLSDREWVCPICGINHHRDMNAAINLMNNAKENTVGATEINACGDSVRLFSSEKCSCHRSRKPKPKDLGSSLDTGMIEDWVWELDLGELPLKLVEKGDLEDDLHWSISCDVSTPTKLYDYCFNDIKEEIGRRKIKVDSETKWISEIE